jgi:excisionase family DNA binding protein
MRREPGTEPRLRSASGQNETGNGASRRLGRSVHCEYQVQSEGAEQMLSQRLLTINEAGTYLALGPWRVRSLIYRGELPFIRLGRRLLVGLKDLDAYINSKRECVPQSRREV